MAVPLRLVLTLVFASLGGVASAAAFDAGTATAPAATRDEAVTAPAAASRSAPPLPPFPATLCPGHPATSFDGAHPARFPARTVAEVLANAPEDAGVRYVLEGIVGVHGAGMWDQQAPDCRPNLLELGPPLFVRRYPATTGAWLIPISYLGTPRAPRAIPSRRPSSSSRTSAAAATASCGGSSAAAGRRCSSCQAIRARRRRARSSARTKCGSDR